MLYQETKNRHTASDSLEGGLSVSSAAYIRGCSDSHADDQAESRYEALERNPDFRKFIENLTASGYFKQELRGSQLWKTLYEKAATAFIEARREECVETVTWCMPVLINMGNIVTQIARHLHRKWMLQSLKQAT